MEMLDIVDENGHPTGVVKERTKVHEDGDLHRTSHVWIVRDTKDGLEVLLQKRSDNKDSFPGCYDTSSAGHIPAGQSFLESALRELHEELGIKVNGDRLEEKGMQRVISENIFHGKVFKDNQISKVYRAKINDLDIDKINLQEEEVESVIWMNLKKCIEAVKNNSIKHCMHIEELEMIK